MLSILKYFSFSQAATGNSNVPNPFKASDGDIFGSAAAGAAPPPRPPPPTSGQNTPATTASPAKSAFEDLNDSIRLALGGSPAHPLPPQQPSTQPPPSGQAKQQPAFSGFDMGGQPVTSLIAGPGMPAVVSGFGSPARQNLVTSGMPKNSDGTKSMHEENHSPHQ